MTLGVRCLDAAPAGWDALLDADPDTTPSHHPEVWRAIAATLSSFETRVIVVEADGRLIGGAPFMIERRAGLCWIHALPFLLPAAPLSLPGHRHAVDLAVADALATAQRELRAVGGEWSCYRAGADLMASHALEIPGGETRWMDAAVLELGSGLDEARRAMGRKTRQGIARAMDSGLRCADDASALEEAYALHARQSRAWSAHRPLPLDLSRRLIASGLARLLTARDARGLLCAAFALEGARETFLWWSGSHPDTRQSESYAALLWWSAQQAAERGCVRLSLGSSRSLAKLESFKDTLGARRVRFPVRWLDARHAPPIGRLAAALQARLRRGRARGDGA
jgi:Acetyltransferase (GNAT) domain